MIVPEKIDLHTVDPDELTPLSQIEYRGWKLGMADGERRLLTSLLEARFGPLSAAQRQRLEAVDSTEELERLGRLVLTATCLADLGLDDGAGS